MSKIIGIDLGTTWHPIKIVYEIKRDPILKDFIKKLENFSSSSH